MSKESDNLLHLRIDELRKKIREIDDPKGDAFRCGMSYNNDPCEPCLAFSFFNKSVELKYPELIARSVSDGKVLNIAYQALICYYLVTAAGSLPFKYEEDNWVSFADLPDGRFYHQAFQSYTGNKLAATIKSDLDKFSKIALKLNGSILDIADLAYQFRVLPKVPVALVYWEGDEDFESRCNILFNKSVSNYLPTDACAIVGSMLTQSFLNQIDKL